jgi:deoxyadenosine/deoxycytidine kinase
MANTIAICGTSGDGKSTAARTLDPKTTVYINADGKTLPFKESKFYTLANKNYIETSKLDMINKVLNEINNRTEVKDVIIDTANGIMLDIEMSNNFRNRKAGGEAMTKWMDLAAEIYDLILKCNSLKKDLNIFVMFHTTNYTDVNGLEKKCIVTNGRKLEKIHLESKFPIVLFTHVKYGAEGKNEYFFETQASSSTGKSPMGMFDSFLIPNDLKLVSDKVREYYN